MIIVLDSSGNNLVNSPPEESLLQVVGETTSVFSVTVTALETLTAELPVAYVAGTIDWNDGSTPTGYLISGGTLALDLSKPLYPGAYQVSLKAHNFTNPQSVVVINWPVTVVRADDPEAPPNIVYGPILPRDKGEPNADSWSFNSSSDLQILESSIKMLLITQKGERTMEPGYGTNLQRILFEASDDSIQSLVEQEIIDAVRVYEPRVQLVGFRVERTDSNRTVLVYAKFLSLLQQQQFETNLRFVR